MHAAGDSRSPQRPHIGRKDIVSRSGQTHLLIQPALGCRIVRRAENCRAAEADNREAVNSYYIRTGGFAAVRLPLRSVLAQGEVVRAVTEPMSAEKMHALAQNIRKDGNDLFFAALEEELC